MDALRDRAPSAWMRLFEDRYKRTTWPYGSGVWGKKEWVCPELRNENVVSMDEGGTNLFWAERFGRELGLDDLWVKMCGNSHTGSFKDLGMTVLVSVVKQMMADGGGIRAVACASTGDTSAALAAYAAAAGIPAVVILPRGMVTPAQLVQPLANGARVLALDTDFDGCMAIVQRLVDRRGRLPRQLDEQPAHRGAEDAVDRDRAAVRLGSARRHHHSRRQPRQRERARRRVRHDARARPHREAPAHRRRAGRGGQSAVPRVQEQLGVRADHGAARRWRRRSRSAIRSRSARRFARSSGTTASSSRRARRSSWTRPRAPICTGLFNCPHTGVALAALEKLVARGDSARRPTGDRDLDGEGLEVHGVQDRVPLAARPDADAALRESAGRTAEQLRRGPPRARRPDRWRPARRRRGRL